MTRPNLFVIGAAKAGTSTLHALLARHPDVFMSPFKEPAYFLGPTDPSARRAALSDRYRNSEREYTSLFDGSAGFLYRGESSTAYTRAPQFTGVARRIYEHNPDSRLIYILRDPVDRAISNYWWNVRYECETRPPLQALREDPLYLDVSYYAMQIKPYLELFGEDRVKLLVFERLVSNPNAEFKGLCRWLGLQSSQSLCTSVVRENSTPDVVVQQRGRSLLERLRRSRAWDWIGSFTPAVVRGWGRMLVEREVDRSGVDLTQAITYLRALQREQVAELEELLGESVLEWKTFRGVEDDVTDEAGRLD